MGTQMSIKMQEKVNLLFIHIPDPGNAGGQQYSVSYVSEQIGCSPGAVSSIRHGRTKKPKMETLAGLAKFFDVPLNYFQLETEEDCIKMIQDREINDVFDQQISTLAVKFRALSKEGREDILRMLDYIIAFEKTHQADSL